MNSESDQRYYFLPLIFGGYLITKPFYVLPSGLPQPADLLILVLFIFIFFTRPIEWRREASAACVCAVAFTVYAVIVSLVHASLERDMEIASNAVYYAFNTILLTSCMYLSQRYGLAMLRTMFYSVALSAYLQVILVIVVSGGHASGERAIAFFNNPNQLGYWSLLSGSLILLLSRQIQSGVFITTTALLSCVYLSALSLSKAALVSMFVLVLLHTMKKTSYAITTLVVLVLGWQIVINVPIGEYVPAYQAAVERLEGIGAQSDDNAQGRGYDRIVEHSEYLLFGAAEDGLGRFNTTFEIHSTLGTVLFSYGIVGLVLFSAMVIYVCKAGGAANAVYLIPAFLYGIAHQGLRFGLFYVLLATVVLRRELLLPAADTAEDPGAAAAYPPADQIRRDVSVI